MSTVTQNISTISVGDWTIETTERVLDSKILKDAVVFDRKYSIISQNGTRYFARSLDNAYALIGYYKNMGK